MAASSSVADLAHQPQRRDANKTASSLGSPGQGARCFAASFLAAPRFPHRYSDDSDNEAFVASRLDQRQAFASSRKRNLSDS